jgi:predicted DNA-binding transcriptional regulator AlpA
MYTYGKPDSGCVRYRAHASSHLTSQPPCSITDGDDADTACLNNRFLELFSGIAGDIRRIADAVAPTPPELVGTPYVAKKLGVTTTWIADLIRHGEIPASCLVPGTGNGKPWKFYRARIDEWLASR